MSTGQDWDRLEDTLTAPRLEALTKYLRINPPAHLLLKAFVGYKQPPEEGKANTGPMAIEEFFKRLPNVVQSDDALAGLVGQEGVIKGRGFI